jgi:hypothetical protein
VRFLLFAAVAFETAAVLLIVTGRARWTDNVAVGLFSASVFLWAWYGGLVLVRRYERRRV